MKLLLFPSQATNLTLYAVILSCCVSRNSICLNSKVQTLSQKRYVFKVPLKLYRVFTLVANALFIDLSNSFKTLLANLSDI